jgi:hypothetical protein
VCDKFREGGAPRAPRRPDDVSDSRRSPLPEIIGSMYKLINSPGISAKAIGSSNLLHLPLLRFVFIIFIFFQPVLTCIDLY